MKPVLQALVLAERVYEDTSGKKIIAGTFNTFLIGQVPPVAMDQPDGSKSQLILGGADPGSPSLYISLTDVVDGTEIILQFVNVSRNQVLFRTGLSIPKSDRLATIEIVAPLPPAAHFVKEPGDFAFEVVWNNEILGSHRILVREL